MAQPEPDFEFVPTRQSLLERLRRWDDEAGWKEFFDTYWKMIFQVARLAGLTAQEAEEVVQETVIDVARQMPGFQYRPAEQGGSFKKWLMNLTQWRIKDQLKKRARQAGVVPLEAVAVAVGGPEEQGLPDPTPTELEERWDEEWEQALTEAALERLKTRVDPRHFQIFHSRVIKGWPARQVADALKVSMAQVYTVTFRLSLEFKALVKELNHRWSAPP